MLQLRTLVLKNRSYRRFYHDEKIRLDQLINWIDLARNSASGRNAQPLKYIAIANEKDGEEIFRHLKWACHFPDWDGPAKEERPVAYIIMLHDINISNQLFCDHGIAAQSILLGAVEEGFGGCIVASVDKKGVSAWFNLPAHLEIIQIIALGKPKETVVIEPLPESGDFRYWRDADLVHHVPKRSLEEVIWLK